MHARTLQDSCRSAGAPAGGAESFRRATGSKGDCAEAARDIIREGGWKGKSFAQGSPFERSALRMGSRPAIDVACRLFGVAVPRNRQCHRQPGNHKPEGRRDLATGRIKANQRPVLGFDFGQALDGDDTALEA